MPTRMRRGRGWLMRLCVAFLMVSLLRDNHNALCRRRGCSPLPDASRVRSINDDAEAPRGYLSGRGQTQPAADQRYRARVSSSGALGSPARSLLRGSPTCEPTSSSIVPTSPVRTKGTAALWEVADVRAAVKDLKGKGVNFEHYDDMPGLTRDGDIHRAGPLEVAWFKDPSGNILSVQNHRVTLTLRLPGTLRGRYPR